MSQGKFWIAIGLFASWSGIASIVDGLIEWKDFFASFLTHHVAFRDFLFGWIPYDLPGWVIDYAIVGSGIAVIVRGIQAHVVSAMVQEFEQNPMPWREQFEAYVQDMGPVRRKFIEFKGFLYVTFTREGRARLNELVQTGTPMDRPANFGDPFAFVMLRVPILHVVLSPVSLLTYRSVFEGLYAHERRFAYRVFFGFWLGALVVIFLFTDYAKTYPHFFAAQSKP